MLYVRFPLSLRNVEDLLDECSIEVSHETVRFWWQRFEPMLASEIRKRRIAGLKSSRWTTQSAVPGVIVAKWVEGKV